VHCGFCLPTCPTYQLWGEEPDSPRGRILLMDLVDKGELAVTDTVVEHWDRCLGCMACVTSCPSGVRYDALIESTRAKVEREYRRPRGERFRRAALFSVLPYHRRLRPAAYALALRLPAPRIAPRLDVLGRERARLTLPTGRLELSLRHSELLLLLAEASVAGEGRTAVQLAGECHPGDAAPVTVRAELSRLRHLVGADLIGSRPYRLRGPLDSDLDRVRRLLARGSVGSALECYPGAVLPGSRAPGVAHARERVSALLRQAVLRSRRPELLLRYAQLPEARDDGVVWQACLDWLPAGSPRRATATAHLHRLRRTSRPR